MTTQGRFNLVLICIAASLSFALWSNVAYFLGYGNWKIAYVTLIELPLIAFYLPFVNGSRLAATGIGMTMVITSALWIYYLHHIVVEHISNERHALRALPFLLVSLFVLVKMALAYNCLLSSTLRSHLKKIQEHNGAPAAPP